MKKTILVFASIAIVASMSSCRKTYTCECTWAGGSMDGQTQTVESDEKLSKSDAKTWCDDNGGSITVNGVVQSTATCELK